MQLVTYRFGRLLVAALVLMSVQPTLAHDHSAGLGPATSLSREERILLTSFDFAGRVEFSDDDRHALNAPKP